MAKKTNDKFQNYSTISTIFHVLYHEVAELTKKKSEATLSEHKVKFINSRLEDVRLLLSDEPEFRYLDLLDAETLPQYSDAILILSQYKAGLTRFRERYARELAGR